MQDMKAHLQAGWQQASMLSSLSESPSKTKNTGNHTNEAEVTSVLTALEHFEVFLAYFWVVLA